MKKILFTQRVEVIESYNERRDSADQNIAKFLVACGYIPMPLCNLPELTEKLINIIKPDGILLTGGNDLQQYGGNAPERDLVERQLIDISLSNDIPLLGLCRGMQVIADYFGAKLSKVEGHVATRHDISGAISRNVNSYHNFGILDYPNSLEITAQSKDGVIEALKHKDKMIVGIMWHPERNLPFDKQDIEMFCKFFNRGKI